MSPDEAKTKFGEAIFENDEVVIRMQKKTPVRIFIHKKEGKKEIVPLGYIHGVNYLRHPFEG